jgi:hypothetical protein
LVNEIGLETNPSGVLPFVTNSRAKWRPYFTNMDHIGDSANEHRRKIVEKVHEKIREMAIGFYCRKPNATVGDMIEALVESTPYTRSMLGKVTEGTKREALSRK